MNESIMHVLNGITIPQRHMDGYINATALAKAYQSKTGKRKDVGHWLETLSAKEYIDFVSMDTDISVSSLILVRKGKPANLQGTYLHPDLAVPFAQWLSVEFQYIVNKWVQQWILHGHETPQSAKHPVGLWYERMVLFVKYNTIDEAKWFCVFKEMVLWHVRK